MSKNPTPHYYKIYWYCEMHDDTFHTIMLHEEKITEISPGKIEYPEDLSKLCCEENTEPHSFGPCETSYIGCRSYSIEDELLEDYTKNFAFHMRSGGYEWKFLDQSNFIGKNPLISIKRAK